MVGRIEIECTSAVATTVREPQGRELAFAEVKFGAEQQRLGGLQMTSRVLLVCEAVVRRQPTTRPLTSHFQSSHSKAPLSHLSHSTISHRLDLGLQDDLVP